MLVLCITIVPPSKFSLSLSLPKECSGDTTSTTPMTVSTPSSSSAPQSPPSFLPSPPPPVILSPCAACKILRRRCAEKCVLAPYFPPTEPLKFTVAHRIFGASNIIKLLQELPESHRADAVSSMVYEANARIRDPVYGSTGAIYQLQKQVSELQAELAKTQVELFNMQCQQANLLSSVCQEMSQPQENMLQTPYESSNYFNDDGYLCNTTAWEPLWT